MTIWGRCSFCKLSAVCMPIGLKAYMWGRLTVIARSRGLELHFGDSITLSDHVRTVICLSMAEVQEEIPYGCAYRYKLEIRALVGPGTQFTQTVDLVEVKLRRADGQREQL